MQNYVTEYHDPCSDSAPLVSVIVPAHNESGRLQHAVESILHVFNHAPQSVEIIIVDDGSTDTTYDEAYDLSQGYPGVVRAIALGSNHGKGYAIRTGFLHSRGEVVGFIDADLEYPVNALPIMATMVLESRGACAIASRVLDDRRPFERLSSQMAHKVASAVLQLPIRDTQAGIKMFPGPFARTALTRCQQEGWLYDIEALLRAVEQHLSIIEVPVMQKSVRPRRASLWAMLACGPALLGMAVGHWQALRRNPSSEVLQVARFGIVGAINSLVDLAAYWGLVQLWSPHRNGFQAGLESLMAWIMASIVGYVLHSRFTFRKRLSHSGFYVVTGLGVAIQVVVTGVITHHLGTNDAVLGKGLGIGLASVVSYIGYRYLARSGQSPAPSPSLVRRANIPTVVGQEP